MLAEETAQTLDEARVLFEQGVAVGERALGEDRLRDDRGHFWGLVDTRPYMRARAGLANCLWLLGQRKLAIWHYQEMLRLSPNDNQGIRYQLLTSLIEADRDGEAFELYRTYGKESTAHWAYNCALLFFRRGRGKQEC